MRVWYNLSRSEREIVESYAGGEFRLLMKNYKAIRRNYYLFGLVYYGKRIVDSDKIELKKLYDRLGTFHSLYSSQHPSRDEVNARVIDARLEISKLLKIENS